MNKKQLKRGVVGTILVFLLSIILPVSQVIAQDSDYGDEYIDIIVRYEGSVPEEESLDSRFKNVHTMDILPIRTMSVPASAIRELSLEKNIRRITYDQEVTTSQSPYEVSSDDWNQTMIGTFDSWEQGYTGKNVNIAILDTGFYQHPEITYAGGYSIFDEDNELGPDVWTNDHSGHGTHVAGILGAHQGTRAQGIAPDADIYGVKIYHESKGDKTRVGNLLTGLNWAIQNESDIIVISSGYPDHNQEVHDTIQAAYEQGILIFAASGNITDDNSAIDYPAVHEEVIAVSGVNQRQARVSDSMVGYENELAAPGQNILSLSPDGAYSTMSGTSQAAPHVAGIAALLMEKYPSEDSEAIRQRLVEQALDLGDTGHDVLYGHGLVQFGENTPEETEPEDDTVEEIEEAETPPADEETDNASGNDETSDETSDDETDSEPTNEPQDETENTNTEDEDSSSDNINENNAEEEAENEATSEEESDSNIENQTEEETVEDDDEPEKHSTIWIRPSETNGVATVAEEDIEAVPNNGVLAISFDSSLGHIERISLSREQVKILKDKNVTLLVARVDLEWVIPIDNLSEGNALITFESTAQELSAKAITKGKILSFGIEQEGQRLTTFPSEMTYRFFTPEVEYNQDALYQWNESTESWELLGDVYTKGGVVGVTSEVGTLAVFNPEELETAIATAKEEGAAEDVKEEVEEKEPEQSKPDVVEEIEFSEEESTGLPVVLSSVVVVLMSVTGGLYFFGGKSKD